MNLCWRGMRRAVGAILLTALCLSGFGGVATVRAQQGTGLLRGQVTDEAGAVIIGATVTAIDAAGTARTATTNNDGQYAIAALVPGAYTVSVTASGFAPFEVAAVDVAPGRREPLNVKLSIALAQEEVTVAAESQVSTAPENNNDAVVLREADLAALPEDPDDLASALQALAGPSAGPNGGQIYIDGFTGTGGLPPRETIREIRVNQNPFAAEYDRPGFGRIEILTKPGTDRFRGQAFFNFRDESLNSRNPFVFNSGGTGEAKRPPYQQRLYGGNVSGPVIKGKASFFIDFERREIDDNANINATILDAAFRPSLFQLAVVTPTRRTEFSPRFDYQLNQNNTLVGRYRYEDNTNQNVGLGQFSLPTRAFSTSSTEHTIQLTETAVLSPQVINETRFQFDRDNFQQDGDNSLAALNVQDAFSGGGAQVGDSYYRETRYEVQNYTTWSLGQHTLKFGGRVRGVQLDDFSVNNFGGTYIFTGGNGVALDAGDQPLAGGGLIPISSLERYRRTLVFQQRGFSASQIRALGGGAAQFSISGGQPQAKISQVDFGGFVQDDWRLRPGLTLSGGLRYETQSNISSKFNFAPRIGIAWTPGIRGGGQAPAPAGFGATQNLVIRAGFGIFYDRFAENYTLQSTRFNGLNQQLFVVRENAQAIASPNNSILDQFPNIPSVAALNAFAQPQAVRRIDPTLQAPYTMQGVFSVEKALPRNVTAFATFITSRNLHALRLRNINTPVSFTAATPSGIRPLGTTTDVLEYESNGRVNQNQFIVGARARFNPRVQFFANYVLNRSRGDADGGFGGFGGGGGASAPANPYDLRAEYGRTSFDIRHRFILFSTLTLPWAVQVSPFVIASSGQPYNFTSGVDSNFDTFFAERPTYAQLSARCAQLRLNPVVRTVPAACDVAAGAADPNVTIPRNFGEGPSNFNLNMNFSRTFSFGSRGTRAGGGDAGGGPGGGPGGGGGGGRGPGGGFGGPGGGGGGRGPGGGGGGPFGGGDGRYNMTVSVRVTNILNKVNLDRPNGNLTSPFFGQSTRTAGGFGPGGFNSGAGNRVVELQLRFSF